MIFVPLVVLLTACPYESAVPITEADAPIDKTLLGKWIKEDDSDNEFPDEYYQIDDLGGRLYEILKFSLNTEDSTYTSETFISHFSDLTKDGQTYRFLNMKKDGNYYLHLVDLNSERFILYEVTDNIDETFSTSEELRAFVEQHMHLSFFYNRDEATFYKVY